MKHHRIPRVEPREIAAPSANPRPPSTGMYGTTRPFVIGIAGGTGSGKTYLANRLVEQLHGGCALLSHDWYYKDLPPASAAIRRQRNFDRPDALETTLLRNHVKALRAGRAIATPRYSYRTHRRLARTVVLEPAPVVIIEGLFVLADPGLRRLCDLKVFVDTPADLRLARRVIRTLDEERLTAREELRLYLTFARDGHARWIEPSRRHADIVWTQQSLDDSPTHTIDEIKRRLACRNQPATP